MSPNPSIQVDHPFFNYYVNELAHNRTDGDVNLWMSSRSKPREEYRQLIDEYLGIQLTSETELLTPSVAVLPPGKNELINVMCMLTFLMQVANKEK